MLATEGQPQLPQSEPVALTREQQRGEKYVSFNAKSSQNNQNSRYVLSPSKGSEPCEQIGSGLARPTAAFGVAASMSVR